MQATRQDRHLPEYGKPLDFKSIAAYLKKSKAEGTSKYRTVRGGYQRRRRLRPPTHAHPNRHQLVPGL